MVVLRGSAVCYEQDAPTGLLGPNKVTDALPEPHRPKRVIRKPPPARLEEHGVPGLTFRVSEIGGRVSGLTATPRPEGGLQCVEAPLAPHNSTPSPDRY